MKNFWTKEKVLVTGAGGFIGSHLVEKLVKLGASVRAFVRYNSRGDPGLLRLASPEIIASLELVGGDLRDPDAVRKAVTGRANRPVLSFRRLSLKHWRIAQSIWAILMPYAILPMWTIQ